MNYEFNGKIDSISYNVKGVPFITIQGQGKVYSLSPKREFKNMVHIGDWAIKHKGEMKVKFIDQYSKKICYIENYFNILNSPSPLHIFR